MRMVREATIQTMNVNDSNRWRWTVRFTPVGRPLDQSVHRFAYRHQAIGLAKNLAGEGGAGVASVSKDGRPGARHFYTSRRSCR